ncbi:MAG TPA: hypothetical protein PLV68_10055, partial [Ilumatobacteraceae bacterium]|nr:hypothetical protein [Ilumatobacteraceae bacterium]
PTMGPGSDRLLRVGFKVRNTFDGGPHNGQAIPVGAIGANYGNVSGVSGTFPANGYNPVVDAGLSGDRLTWTRAVLGVKKLTVAVDGMCDAPCAQPIDVNGSVLAGKPIIWEIRPVVNAGSPTPAPVNNLTLTDVLPVYVEYDDACTAALTGGTPADDVLFNTPAAGQTTLVWNVGTVIPNTEITPYRICTQTDPIAPAP